MALQKNYEKRARPSSRFLVASPYATDTPYERSVILLIRSDMPGATGILLDSEFRDAYKRIQQRVDAREAPPTEPLAENLKLRVVNWAMEELQTEAQQGLWLTTLARQDDLARGDDLWVTLVRRVGREVLHDSLGIEAFPADPMLN